MQPERWQKVVGVFQAALECGRSRRPAFLQAACQGDPLLLREVESLFSAYDRDHDTDDRTIDVQDKVNSLAGRSVGAYKIIREIGRGGMGAVYLAARADQEFDRLVAIKPLLRLDSQVFSLISAN